MMQADTGQVWLSLVVATVGDGSELGGLLASLAVAPSQPRFEVVIVDQNADERLVPVVARYADALSIRHERVPFRGASRARNHGARVARGTWLGFPDDDCVFLEDTISSVARVARDPLVGVVTGQTVDEDGRPSVLRWGAEATDFDRWTMFKCLTEATLFVERELFLAVGGFDENFGPGARWPAAEGVELMNRLFTVMEGRKARFDPAVKMRHPNKIPPWNRWAASRFYQYAQGDGALISKSPSLPVLNWGCRTLLAAARGALTFDPWKSAAYLLRAIGLCKGFLYHRLSRQE
jgi:glycosyltransferase involved in cell wall biosynthesis